MSRAASAAAPRRRPGVDTRAALQSHAGYAGGARRTAARPHSRASSVAKACCTCWRVSHLGSRTATVAGGFPGPRVWRPSRQPGRGVFGSGAVTIACVCASRSGLHLAGSLEKSGFFCGAARAAAHVCSTTVPTCMARVRGGVASAGPGSSTMARQSLGRGWATSPRAELREHGSCEAEFCRP